MGGEHWPLIKAIKFALKQHNEGMKLDDLLEQLSHMKDAGELVDCCVANVLDAVEQDATLDYKVYGSNRYFIFILE